MTGSPELGTSPGPPPLARWHFQTTGGARACPRPEVAGGGVSGGWGGKVEEGPAPALEAERE